MISEPASRKDLDTSRAGVPFFLRLPDRAYRLPWRWNWSLLARWTAHLSVILIALAVLLTLRGLQLPPSAWGGPAGETVYPPSTPTSVPRFWVAAPPLVVNRAVVPDTTIPPRPRASVITYTVQPGDSLSSIAQQFGLSIWTIIWSNREAVWDAPWLIQPGLTLYIPPVDGVYHTVREGETIESIAEKYGVRPEALFNEWNNLKEGQPLEEGMQLMVVGGRDKYIDLTPPPPKPVARGGASGICRTAATGPVGTGWFIYPTGSTRVSGWYFTTPGTRAISGWTTPAAWATPSRGRPRGRDHRRMEWGVWDSGGTGPRQRVHDPLRAPERTGSGVWTVGLPGPDCRVLREHRLVLRAPPPL